jgi:hypothetical protein
MAEKKSSYQRMRMKHFEHVLRLEKEIDILIEGTDLIKIAEIKWARKHIRDLDRAIMFGVRDFSKEPPGLISGVNPNKKEIIEVTNDLADKAFRVWNPIRDNADGTINR